MFEPLTDRSIRLADGRSMAVAEWGVLDGPAVLYFPGTPHSRLWCPSVAGTESAGVHLVTVDRPGYGRSDPAPAEMTLGAWTSDVTQLADALHLDRFGVVGWSGGGLSALACAAMIPERLTGAGEMGGAGWPVDEQPGALEALSEPARRIHHLAWTDRRAALQLAEDLAPDWLVEARDHPESIMADTDPPQDLRHFSDPAWAESFYGAVRDSLRLGRRAYAWGTVASLGPWGFALEDVVMDFHLWHGAHDPNASLADVEYWAGRIPGAKVTVYEDSGHFAVVDHWREMLEVVVGGR